MIRCRVIGWLVCVLAVLAYAEPPAFRAGIELSTQLPVTPAVRAAMKELGIGYVNYYIKAAGGDTDENAVQVNNAMIELCDSLELEYSISCYQFDPPDECVRQAIRKSGPRFQGVVFDELEHVRLLNLHSPSPLADAARFGDLNQAREQTLDGYRRLHDRYAKLGSSVVATHVWPVLLHEAARAGFVVCPKICKEFYSPVSLAIGLGAAKQYGRELWADCDLWFWDLIPGHCPEEFRSNLLLAYWLGADRVYVEGAGYNLYPAGKQGLPFSLMKAESTDAYKLTPHGEVLKSFCRTYVPEHPRPWTFRDVQPDIAVVRFEDTCHGQRYTADFPDRLYGSDKLKSDRDTEAWLGLWNLLTFGRTGRDGLSLFKAWVGPSSYEKGVTPGVTLSYRDRPAQADMHRFFVPLHGVVVYDHTVGYDLLKGVPLLFLTGKQVGDETARAIRRCVAEGALCVAWAPLATRCGLGDGPPGVRVVPHGKGRFVVTDDFGFREVYREIATMIGRSDEIRYRFGGRTVVLKRVTDNEIRVELQ